MSAATLDALERCQQRLDAVEERYGPRSQAVLVTLQEFLLVLLDAVLHSGEAPPTALTGRVSTVRARLGRLYAQAPPAVALPGWCRVVDPAVPVVEFDRAAYAQRYADRDTSGEVEVAGAAEIAAAAEFTTRMYVLTPAGELRLSRRAYTRQEVIAGRLAPAGGRGPLTHAMMVPDGLRAVAAGEITFVGPPDRRGAVANLRSGHFRPPPRAARRLREHLAGHGCVEPSCVVVYPLLVRHLWAVGGPAPPR